MKYVFGPVPSRRLGQSLGIDTIPLKTCNWNCVYCQLGRTRPLTNERKEYTPCKEVIIELRQALAAQKLGQVDWVTFVGSGEPTLHSSLGWLIRQAKASTALPVAVITNGSLLYIPAVRDELAAADAVLPSLDAGCSALYRKINRPWPKLTFERLLEGLIVFRKEFSGKLWLEIMLMRGLNDTEQALMEIAALIDRIQPDQVHINQPTRPPAESWVQPASLEGLQRAQSILGEASLVVSTSRGLIGSAGSEDLAQILMNTITRHPMKEDELIDGLQSWTPEQIRAILACLESEHRAQKVRRYGATYWSAARAFYSDNSPKAPPKWSKK